MVFTGLLLVPRYTIKYNSHGYLVKKKEKTSCSASKPLVTWTSANRFIVSCARAFVVITNFVPSLSAFSSTLNATKKKLCYEGVARINIFAVMYNACSTPCNFT